MGVVKSATTPQVASTTPARSRRPPAHDVLAPRPSMDAARAPDAPGGSVEGADLDDVLGIRASDLDYVLGIRASINADDDSVKGEAVAAADKDLENDVLRPGASIIENAACVEGEAVAAADGDLTRCAYECLYDLTRCAYECLYSD